MYRMVRITEETYNLITDAEATFLKQNPDLKGMGITKDFLVNRALKLYVYGSVD